MSSTEKQEVIFFLGAGASVKAGVPDTFGLVDKFKEILVSEPSDLTAIEKILAILKSWKGKLLGGEDIDVELLLETLEQLDAKDQDILLQFHTVGQYALAGYSPKRPLKEQLKNFIKRSGIVTAGNVRYLDPLLSFVDETRPLDIFSVNYDTCIEQFCSTYKKDYVDGFDLHWNSKVLERNDVDIRLYKLHGSILWYKTDRGDYVKLPIKTAEATMELVTGEKAATLILYPMRKWEYAEPFLELLLKLKEMLERAKFVIVVGYSFRDDYITRIFWDSARRNKNLTLVLISPSSQEIYENRLETYKTPELPHAFSVDFEPSDFDAYFPSSLSGRVIRLPYKFEETLPILKNYYLKELREGLTEEKAQKEKENRGEPSYWVPCLKHFAACQFTDKITEIAPKINWEELEDREIESRLQIEIGALLSYLALGDDPEAKRWSEKLIVSMSPYSVDNLQVEVVLPSEIRLGFKTGKDTSLSFQELANILQRILAFSKQRPDVANKERLKRIQTVIKAISEFCDYLHPLKDFGIRLENYIALRQQNYPNLASLLEANLVSFKKEGLQETSRTIRDNVRVIEQNELKRVFSGSNFQLNL